MRKVLGDLIIIKVDDYQRMKGGLYQAEQWKTTPATGEVLAIGPDVNHIKVGDRVFFKRFSIIDSHIEGEKFCQEKHIMEVL
jgi:co-chaperonin GroES (HSP10)